MSRKNFLEQFIHRTRGFVLLFVLLVFIPIFSNWVADIAKSYFVDTNPLPLATRVVFWVGVAGLLLFSGVSFWLGRKLLPTRIVEQTPNVLQRRVLVALLSPCNNLTVNLNKEWFVTDTRKESTPPHALANLTLDQIVEANCALPQWSWQQTLRAADHHRGCLEKLVLVGSKGGSGTDKQLQLAYDFFSTYFPGKVVIFGKPESGQYDTRWQADFEDLRGLLNLLRNIVREILRDKAGYTESDIVIDCTGGFKITSIAAALVTLDRPDLIFQYVGTFEHTGQIIGFNAVSDYHSS